MNCGKRRLAIPTVAFVPLTRNSRRCRFHHRFSDHPSHRHPLHRNQTEKYAGSTASNRAKIQGVQEDVNEARGHLFLLCIPRCCLFRPRTVQTLRQMGRADSRGLSRCHSPFQRRLSASIRHPGKTRPASPPRHRSSKRAPRVSAGDATRVCRCFSAVLLRSDF